MNTPQNPKTEIKVIKHTFTLEERDELGGQLACAISSKRGVESEFDGVKSSYKAKVSEADARIDKFSTDLANRFEMREAKCVVLYRPREKKKDFLLFSDWDQYGIEANPVLTEDMSQGDFEQELIEAESEFDLKAELPIIAPAGNDRGLLIVGRLGGKWFSALRVAVGQRKIEERLDS